MDEDLDSFSRDELVQEVIRLRNGIRRHRDRGNRIAVRPSRDGPAVGPGTTCSEQASDVDHIGMIVEMDVEHGSMHSAAP